MSGLDLNNGHVGLDITNLKQAKELLGTLLFEAKVPPASKTLVKSRWSRLYVARRKTVNARGIGRDRNAMEGNL
jgi:hypothetical protein